MIGYVNAKNKEVYTEAEMMELQLGDVEATTIIPLAVRVSETKRKSAGINDFETVKFIDKLNIDTKKSL